MNLDSVEPNFVELMGGEPPRIDVSSFTTRPVADFEAQSIAAMHEKVRSSCVSPTWFPVEPGTDDRKHGGIPYMTIKFPGSDFSIDRLFPRAWDKVDGKYRYPKNTKPEVFVLRGSLDDYAQSKWTGIAEGQLKAGALDRALNIPFVGIHGVSGWYDKVKAVNESVAHQTVRPEILKGLGAGRKHFVCFDGDWRTNEQVAKELGTYCTEASGFGSEVIVPDFGSDKEGKRLGGDDWLFQTFGEHVPAAHVVLNALEALPRVDWQALPVKSSYFTDSDEKYDTGYIDFSDRGNATLLLRIYGHGNLRYLKDTREWACYGLDGKWKLYPDDSSDILLPVIRQRLNDSKHFFDLAGKADAEKAPQLEKTANQALRAHQSLSSSAGASAVLKNLRGRLRVIASRTDFDANKYILNTPAGVVDLRTGKLRPATREAARVKVVVASVTQL